MARRSRKMLWAPFGAGNVALAASAVVGVDMMSLIRTAVPSINNFTVVRIRGSGSVRSSSVTATSLFFEAGMVITTQPAFDAGAFPDPENDDASYMYRETMLWTPLLVREIAAGNFVPCPQIYMIDVKAKRRVDQADNTLVYILKNRQANAGVFTIEGMALLNLR